MMKCGTQNLLLDRKTIAEVVGLLCVLFFLCSCGSYKFPMPASFYSSSGSSDATASSYDDDYVGASAGVVVAKKGDTLYSIAKENGVPLKSLIVANGLDYPYTLKVGQRIRVPAAASYSTVHTVAKGDTVYSISRKYGVDMRALAKANGLKAPYALKIGQRLVLPVGAAENTAGKTAAKAASSSSASASAASVSATAPKKVVKAKGKIPTPPARESSRFAWPLKGKIILAFGNEGSGRHNDGINIKAKKGDTVVAAENGVVAYAGNELKGFGNLVLVKHADGWMTAYAHLDQVVVWKGQKISRKQKVGTAGDTGNVTSVQLHFEIRKGTKAKDPILYLEKL